jgi:signal peptide peptidase SppA
VRRLPAAFASPWAITPEWGRIVLGVWSRGEFFGAEVQAARERALLARDGQPLENARNATVRDGVALIPVSGPLMRHASMFADISGATSYADVRKDLEQALNDPGVSAILFDVNSPGGEVDGVAELGDAIMAARGRKPIWAYVGGLGASAAYWLTTAAEHVVCAETAMLGSIGVRLALMDDSARDAKEGVRTIEIISSQSPGKRDRPVDDEVIARAQSNVDELAAIFIAKVAAQRGVSVDEVMAKFGQGDVLVGASAVKAGMADELGSLEGTIAQLRAARASPPTIVGAKGKASTGRGAPAAKTKSTPASRAAPEVKNMPKKLKMGAFRAEGAPPEPMPEGETDEKCAHCGGSGTNPDGSKCSTCDGSGSQVAAADDDDAPESADDDDKPTGGDGDGDEDDKPKGADEDDDMGAEDDDKKEEAAFRQLAAKHGLPPAASRHEVLLAAASAPKPVAVSAQVQKLVAEQFAAEKKKQDKAAARSRAKSLAAMVARGYAAQGVAYSSEEQDALRQYAEFNYPAAELAHKGALEKGRALMGRLTESGSPSGMIDRPTSAGVKITKLPTGQTVVKHTGFAEAAREIAAKEKITIEAAQDRLIRTAQGKELFNAYLGGLSQ